MRSVLRVLLSFLLLASATGFGQSTYGSIVGVITDSTGAVIVGGTVTVTNTETNIAKVVNTSGNGGYEATHLLPGIYRVRTEFQGFKSAVRQGIVVESRAVVRIDFELEVGSARTEVQVTASTPVIETETAQIANTRTARQLRDLPSLTKEETFTYLFTLPGAQQVTSSQYSFNGSRAVQNDFLIDGIAAPRGGGAPITGIHNTLAMVSELRLQSANNSAEAQALGVVSIVTRAGTNQLRGTLLYEHENSALNARNFFSPTKVSTKTHTFSAVLGGPVYIPKVYDGHDRTFFMLSLWGQRIPGGSTLNSTVPTPAMRGGDFSAVAGSITDPATGQPFPRNVIPPNRFSPVALRVLERFYPLPNFGDPNVLTANNNRTPMTARNLSNRWEARIDQKISDKNMIFARLAWRGAVQEPFERLPTIPPRNQYRRGSSFVLSDAHTFGTSLVNEFRFGRTTSPNQVLGSLSGLEVLRYAGIQGITPRDYRGMPQFSFSGLVTDANSTNHNVDRYHSFTIADSLTWIRGKHTAKWGFDLVHQGNDGLMATETWFGQFSFNGYFTGNAWADFLLGLPQQATRSTYREYQDIRAYSQHLFFEDTWRVGPKITLTLGARHEVTFASTDSEGLMYNLDLRSMDLVVPDKAFGSSRINPLLPATIKIVKASEAGYPQTLRALDKNNIAPRIGLAVRPFQKMVVRAGYGIFLEDFGFMLTPPSGGPLYAFSETFQNTDRRRPQYTFPNPFGVSGSIGTINASGFNVKLKNPYTQQWNLTVEREFADVGVRLSYIGTKGTNICYTRQQNVPFPSTTPFNSSRRPYPQYGSLTFSDNGGNSIYHGLQADAQRRFGRNLYFQAAWTWSNLISDVSDSGSNLGPTIENPFDRGRDRGRLPYSVRHRVNGALVWDLPVGRGRRFLTNLPIVLNEVAGGWTVSTLLYLETGRYFSPSFSGRDISGTGATSGRPDRIANGNLPPSERQLTRWFDPSAFAVPPANSGRFGNSGVNILEGPGLKAQHFSVTKRLYQRNEHTNLEFQFNMLNLFNHPNFNPPSANISTPSTVAQVQSTRGLLEVAGGRTMSAILRINF